MIRGALCALSALAIFVGLLPLASVGADQPGVVQDQFIVVLRPGTDPHAAARSAEQAQGVQTLFVYENALDGFAFKGSAQAAQALGRDPNVELVSQDRVVQAVGQTTPTGVTRIGGDLNATAKIDGVDERVNVNVAMIDTGVDTTHPDLKVIGGKNCNDGTSYGDGNGHGTHTAGTVGALDNGSGVVGVAPGARLWAVRVLNNAGSGTWSQVICGIDWATGTRIDSDLTNDIAVASMSLGGSGSQDAPCSGTSDALHKAICGSIAKGIVYVVAAGNNSADASTFVPAAYDEVLTVSAIADYDGQAGGGASPTCTNYGPDDSLASFSNFGRAVDIAAPGVCILSTWKGGGYNTISGTSMATPHVTGAAALYVANNGAASDANGVAAIRSAIVDPANGYAVAQSDPKGFSGDPDGYHEPMLNVGPKNVHDVAITGITAPASPVTGQGYTVTLAVSNQGTYDETFSVSLTDSAGSAIGSASVGQPMSLAAGRSANVTFSWLPSSAGSHVMTGSASTVSGESSTSNNTRTTTLNVSNPAAAAVYDAAVTAVSGPTSVKRGSNAIYKVTVKNQGNAVASFNVTLKDDTTSLVIGTKSVKGLAPGASTTLSFKWSVSSSTSTVTHTLTARAALAGDGNPTNDSQSIAVQVT